MPTCSSCQTQFTQGSCPLCWPVEWRSRPGQTALVPPSTRQVVVSSAPHTGDEVVEGTVIQSSGPSHASPTMNGWKLASGLVGFIALSPLVVAGVALRLVLSIVGLHRSGGRSLLDELFMFHGMGRFMQRPEPVAVYHHVVETNDRRQHLVQQRGEFTDGRVLVGHRVRFEGRRVRGTLLLARGVNVTLGASLSQPGNPWRAAFFVLLVLVAVEVFLAAPWLGGLKGLIK
jgi:hypothetical protein